MLDLAHLMSWELLERFRLYDSDLLLSSMRYERFTKRELLTGVFKAWKELGQPKPRGWVKAPFDDAK